MRGGWTNQAIKNVVYDVQLLMPLWKGEAATSSFEVALTTEKGRRERGTHNEEREGGD